MCMPTSIPVTFAGFLVVLFAYFGKSQSNNFSFHGFLGQADLYLNGRSVITPNGLLRLTDESQYVAGHAFYRYPMNMFIPHTTTVSSFSTCFVFAIVPGNLNKAAGHGFAFAISPSNQLSEASYSHYLGLFNSSNDGDPSNHVFAVEFDTVGASRAFGDAEDNHVGIDINGINSSYTASAASYGLEGTKKTIYMETGAPIKVWIDYDGVHKYINVTLAPLSELRPSAPLLSVKLDLSPTLKDSSYVGFSAATGKLTSSHYILGWSFKTNGTTQDIESSALPSLPVQVGRTFSSSTNSRRTVLVSISVMLLVIVTASSLFLLNLYRLRRKKMAECLEEWELNCPHRFPYKDLYCATKGFKASEVIGAGGFGVVYKGVLPKTGEEIAVKRITNSSRQGLREFIAEIETLGRLSHRNLVHLLGWCKRNDDLLLVYDFVINGSLDASLRNNDLVLSWAQRYKIVKGIASALLYLHEDWEQVVVHRDIKASNVLLDTEMNGRLGDFGLARLYDHGENPQTTHVVGTFGYIAPEFARTGKATTSSDVFAYGTLLLVMVSGRSPNARILGRLTLLDWVSECYCAGRVVIDVVDPNLQSSYVYEEANMVLKLGLLCTHCNPESRPSMRQAMRYLSGDDHLPDGRVSADFYLHHDRMDPRNVTAQSETFSLGSVSTYSYEEGR